MTVTDQAPVNLRHINPVPLPKTVLLVNNFIINTTKFLNRFSNQCELKLADVSNRITNIETSLSVLECKLRSIPGLEQPTDTAADETTESPPSEVLPNPEVSTEGPRESPVESNALVVVESSEGAETPGPEEADQEEEAVPATGMVKASEHPDYQKYYKMSKMGVIQLSVMQRMNGEAPHLAQALQASHAETPELPLFDALIEL